MTSEMRAGQPVREWRAIGTHTENIDPLAINKIQFITLTIGTQLIEELKKLLDADPFHDFTLIMTDGHAYVVKDPFQISIGKSVISYFFPKTDRMAYLRMTEVTTIDANTVPGGEA
ncbi:MAG TPA: hypothetical protein VH253_20860 [Phycisphaerae bacterium]|nr:hypothetical protein [Phycisphaerae bacterium]